MNKEPRDNHGRIKCDYCGGYGYHFIRGEHGQEKCPSCQGTGVSQKPAHLRQSAAQPEDLDLP